MESVNVQAVDVGFLRVVGLVLHPRIYFSFLEVDVRAFEGQDCCAAISNKYLVHLVGVGVSIDFLDSARGVIEGLSYDRDVQIQAICSVRADQGGDVLRPDHGVALAVELVTVLQSGWTHRIDAFNQIRLVSED